MVHVVKRHAQCGSQGVQGAIAAADVGARHNDGHRRDSCVSSLYARSYILNSVRTRHLQRMEYHHAKIKIRMRNAVPAARQKAHGCASALAESSLAGGSGCPQGCTTPSSRHPSANGGIPRMMRVGSLVCSWILHRPRGFLSVSSRVQYSREQMQDTRRTWVTVLCAWARVIFAEPDAHRSAHTSRYAPLPLLLIYTRLVAV
jgi:hypothetical protein